MCADGVLFTGTAGVSKRFRDALSTLQKRSLIVRLLLGRSLELGHRQRGSVCVIGLRCRDVCNLLIAESAAGRVFSCALSFVIGWSWGFCALPKRTPAYPPARGPSGLFAHEDGAKSAVHVCAGDVSHLC